MSERLGAKLGSPLTVSESTSPSVARALGPFTLTIMGPAIKSLATAQLMVHSTVSVQYELRD